MSSHISQTDQSYTVIGMTCEHCVLAVTEEVGAIPAVTDAGRLIGEGREKTATMGSGADRPAIAF
ncbi:MAG: heavy-metal-associated domain-containing protein [Actinomycetota bacterium]|nr:heavy-metal-associated domain-containing protein [Actinomycetota bacterium]